MSDLCTLRSVCAACGGRSFSSSWVMLDHQSPAARLQRLRRKSTLHRSSRVWRTCPCNRSRADAITRPFSRVRPAHYMWSTALYPNLGGLSRSCGRDHGMGVGRAKGSEAGRGPVGSSHQAARLRGTTPASCRVDSDSFMQSTLGRRASWDKPVTRRNWLKRSRTREWSRFCTASPLIDSVSLLADQRACCTRWCTACVWPVGRDGVDGGRRSLHLDGP